MTWFGAGIDRPNFTTFARLEELGLDVVGQHLEPTRTVSACRFVEQDSWCRRCGREGSPRDSVLRRLAHEPMGWRPHCAAGRGAPLAPHPPWRRIRHLAPDERPDRVRQPGRACTPERAHSPSDAPSPDAPPTSWPTSTGPAPPTARPKPSTDDSNTCADRPSASATSPTTSPNHYSNGRCMLQLHPQS